MPWSLRRQRATVWIDLTTQLLNGWVAASLRVKRDGDIVLVESQSLDGSAATSDNVVQLPIGFFIARRSFVFSTGLAAAPVQNGFTNNAGVLALPRTMAVTNGYAAGLSQFPVPGVPFPKGAS
jgi:hypothetical protein